MVRLSALSLSLAFFVIACGGEPQGSGGSGGSTTGTPTGGAAGNGGAGGTSTSNGGGGSSTAGSGGGSAAAACAASSLPPPAVDCALPDVLCVDDTPGPTQELASLQEAAAAVAPGQTVVVFDGTYEGFQVDASGTADKPIVFFANGDVHIGSPAPTGDGIRLQNASHVRIVGFRIADMPQRCIAARGATPDAPMTDDWI